MPRRVELQHHPLPHSPGSTCRSSRPGQSSAPSIGHSSPALSARHRRPSETATTARPAAASAPAAAARQRPHPLARSGCSAARPCRTSVVHHRQPVVQPRARKAQRQHEAAPRSVAAPCRSRWCPVRPHGCSRSAGIRPARRHPRSNRNRRSPPPASPLPPAAGPPRCQPPPPPARAPAPVSGHAREPARRPTSVTPAVDWTIGRIHAILYPIKASCRVPDHNQSIKLPRSVHGIRTVIGVVWCKSSR